MALTDFGTVPASTTLYVYWTSHAGSTGAMSATTNLAVGDILIYKNGSTTQRSSTSGFTLLDTDGLDFDGITGLNGVSIDLSDNTDSGFYAVGSSYRVIIGPVTIDSQTMYIDAASFRIGVAENTSGTPVVDAGRINNVSTSSVTTINANVGTTQPINYTGTGASALAKVDVQDYGGSAGTFASGRPEVNVSHWKGTAAAAVDTAGYPKVTVKAGSGTGELDVTSGVVKANLAQILGTALTETSGQIAAGFKKLFDVASPVFTLLSVVQTGDSYARLGAPAGASVSADIAAAKVDTAAIKVQTDKLTFTVANQVDANVLDWKSSTAPAMTGDAYARLGAPAGASVSADIAAVKVDTAATLDDTGTSGVVVASGSKTGYALTSAYDFAKGTVAVTESYAAANAAPTPVQALLAILQKLYERSVSGTTETIKKLDGSTTAATETLDDATNPTSVTRAT